MGTFAGRLSLGFSAGCLGALVNSAVAWFLGDAGLPQRLGVEMAPAFTVAWLYPRLVWGGLWGIALLFPVFPKSHVLRGLMVSVLPSFMSLLWFLPSAGKGMFGMDAGLLAPAFVVFYNAVWGIAAGSWFALASGQAKRF